MGLRGTSHILGQRPGEPGEFFGDPDDGLRLPGEVPIPVGIDDEPVDALVGRRRDVRTSPTCTAAGPSRRSPRPCTPGRTPRRCRPARASCCRRAGRPRTPRLSVVGVRPLPHQAGVPDPAGKRAVTAWVGWYTHPSSCGSRLTQDHRKHFLRIYCSRFLNSPPAPPSAGTMKARRHPPQRQRVAQIAAPPAVDARDRARYGRIRPHPDRGPVDRAPDRPPGPTLDEHRLLLGIGPRAELGRKGVLVSRERAAAAPRQ